MRQPDIGATTNNIVEGGVAAVTVAVLKQTVLTMIPFALPALVLVFLDLWFGVKAARHRYKKWKREADRVTFSKALRGTVGKIMEFSAWLVLSSSASIAFEKEWIQWLVLGLVYLNEFGSIVGNYLCTKDIEFSLLGFLKAVLVFVARWIGNKIGVVTDDVSFEDVLKPAKQKRDEKGRFTAKI